MVAPGDWPKFKVDHFKIREIMRKSLKALKKVPSRISGPERIEAAFFEDFTAWWMGVAGLEKEGTGDCCGPKPETPPENRKARLFLRPPPHDSSSFLSHHHHITTPSHNQINCALGSHHI